MRYINRLFTYLLTWRRFALHEHGLVISMIVCRQQQYDKNLERIMVERGFSMSPVPYLQNLRQPLAALRGDDR